MKSHDSASTAGLSVTQGDAVQIARVLRKTESMPLSKLCAQIRRENYNDWARWERSLDFGQTMAGRYGLSCPDQATFSFTQDGAQAPQQVAVGAYWRMRLTTDSAQETVPATPAADLPLWSAAQRSQHAGECLEYVTRELHAILTQCAQPGADVDLLVQRYEPLAQTIAEAEASLGVSLECDALQLQVETTLLALV